MLNQIQVENVATTRISCLTSTRKVLGLIKLPKSNVFFDSGLIQKSGTYGDLEE